MSHRAHDDARTATGRAFNGVEDSVAPDPRDPEPTQSTLQLFADRVGVEPKRVDRCGDVLGDTRAIVPSTKKVGGVGARLDVPVTHVNASYVRSHFDAMEVGLNDSPRADEILLALVMTTGARIHNRAGGLAATDIRGEDGLR